MAVYDHESPAKLEVSVVVVVVIGSCNFTTVVGHRLQVLAHINPTARFDVIVFVR